MKVLGLRAIAFSLVFLCIVSSCVKYTGIDLSELYIDPLVVAGDEVKEWDFINIQADMYVYGQNSGNAEFDTTIYWNRQELSDMKLWFYRDSKLATTPRVASFFEISTSTTWAYYADYERPYSYNIVIGKSHWKVVKHIPKKANSPENLILTALFILPNKDQLIYTIVLETQ